MSETNGKGEIEGAVRQIVADSLDLEVDDVRLESRLVGDLDADSLDVLDVSYRVDRQFGISLPILDLSRKLQESPDDWLGENSTLTEVGLKALTDLVPELSRLGLAAGDAVETVLLRLTVADLVEMIANHVPAEASPEGNGEVGAKLPLKTSADA